jgi:hypothetical protein
MTTSCLATLNRIKKIRVQVPGAVETRYQTQKIQSAQGWKGGIKQKEIVTLHSRKSKKNKRIRSQVPRDESQVSVGGLLALGYGRKQRMRKKR